MVRISPRPPQPSSTTSSGVPTPKQSADRFEDLDKWYWDYIEKYRDDPEAYAYLSQNPYLRKDNTYSPSFGDSIMSLFGDYSAENNFYRELQQHARGYLSDWENRMYQQKYDSPVEQVKREQAAGINPDLSPQSISPGSAAENDQPFQTVGQPTAGTGISVAKDMAAFGLQFVGSVLSFGKQIQDLNVGSMNLVSHELGASSGARDLILNELSNIDLKSLQDKSPKDVLNLKIFSGYSPRTRKFLQHYLERYTDGDTLAYQTLVAELRNRKLNANRSNAEIMSSPYYSEDLNKWTSQIMENYSKYVALADKYIAATNASRAEVEATLYGDEANQNVYGEMLAQENDARRQTAESTKEAAKWKREMDKTWNELEKSVKGDGDHWYNTIGIILLQFLRAQVNQPISLGLSQSEMVSNSYGKNGSSHTESHSSSFHL